MKMDIDIEPYKTHVYVHSPLTECSPKGSYYTSYAIHLMSNNPCFTHKSSHIRRRYSEFVYLRHLLAVHHPPVKPPSLPPKKLFFKFSDEFIEERMKGLQTFLNEVLAIPVYLSEKSLHLFLQSSSSMSTINEECLGDIPAPQLLTSSDLVSSLSDTRSKSSDYLEASLYIRSLQNLVLDDCLMGVQNSIPVPRTSEIDNKAPKFSSLNKSNSNTLNIQNIAGSVDSCASSSDSNVDIYGMGIQSHIPVPRTSEVKEVTKFKSAMRKSNARPYNIPKVNGSVESSPTSSSASSLDISYSTSPETMKERRVSFSDTVGIAVVTEYGICVLR